MSGFQPPPGVDPDRPFVVGSRVLITGGARRGHAGWIFAPFSSSQAASLRWEIELDNGCHTVVAETDISHA